MKTVTEKMMRNFVRHARGVMPSILCKATYSFVLVACLVLTAQASSAQEKVGAEATADATASKPPNVLFILTDDQRHTAVGYAGNDTIITPNIDALSQRGLSFSNAHISGAMSAAVCAPSRAMLMTGRNLFEISQTGEQLPAEQVTLPEWLKQHGYHTFHTGKWHNGRAAFVRSFSDAKDIFFGGMSDQYEVPLHAFSPEGDYSQATVNASKRHSTDIYADAAVEFISQYKSDAPFFAFVSFQSPHDPKQALDKYLNMYDPASFKDIPNLLSEHPFDNGELDVRDEWLSPLPRTQNDAKAHLASYYAMITHIDERIGDILNALQASGKSDNTIVVFSSDNGIAMGQHGLLGKQSLYEHSLRVPLLFAGPGIPKGKTSNDLVMLSQVFATLTDLLAFSKPESLTQASFAQELLLPTTEHKQQSAVFAYKSYQRAIKQGDFKLIEYQVNEAKHTQLFNIAADPLETLNLVNAPEHKERVEAMQASLQKELSLAGDQAMLSAPDWALEPIPQWGPLNLQPERRENYFKLKKMAEEEHKMVIDYFK